MSNKQRITGHLNAFTTGTGRGTFDDVIEAAKQGRKDEALGILAFSATNMTSIEDWTMVGIATVTVEFFPREQIVAREVEGLREQLRQHRINAHAAEQALLDKISKLQAITA